MSNKTYNDQLANDKRNYGAVALADGSWLHNDGDIYRYDDDGQVHSLEGPAVIDKQFGELHWYMHGNLLSFDIWILESTLPDNEKMLLRLQYG